MKKEKLSSKNIEISTTDELTGVGLKPKMIIISSNPVAQNLYNAILEKDLVNFQDIISSYKFIIHDELQVSLENKRFTFNLLHILVYEGFSDAIHYLLYNFPSIDLNTQASNGATPLITAIHYKDTETVEILLNKGAEVNTIIKKGWTPLMIAVQGGYQEAVELLIRRGADIDKADSQGFTSVHYAADNGYLEIMKKLLGGRANPNRCSSDGCTPLMLATLAKHKEVVKLLIKHGVDIDKGDDEGCTPLMLAAQKGYKEIAEVLIKGGADIDESNNFGYTPLHYAAQEGYTEIVEILVMEGAKIDKTDEDNSSPLLIAVENAQTKVSKILIENGADIYLADVYGNSPFKEAFNNSHFKIITSLLENGMEVNQVEINGYLPLTWYAQCGNVEIVNLLIDHGADINLADKYGETPFESAIINDKLGIVKLLIEKGINVNQADSNGDPILFLATAYISTKSININIIKELLKTFKADLSQCNGSGEDIFEFALKLGATEVFNVLSIYKGLYDLLDGNNQQKYLEAINTSEDRNFAKELFEVYLLNKGLKLNCHTINTYIKKLAIEVDADAKEEIKEKGEDYSLMLSEVKEKITKKKIEAEEALIHLEYYLVDKFQPDKVSNIIKIMEEKGIANQSGIGRKAKNEGSDTVPKEGKQEVKVYEPVMSGSNKYNILGLKGNEEVGKGKVLEKFLKVIVLERLSIAFPELDEEFLEHFEKLYNPAKLVLNCSIKRLVDNFIEGWKEELVKPSYAAICEQKKEIESLKQRVQEQKHTIERLSENLVKVKELEQFVDFFKQQERHFFTSSESMEDQLKQGLLSLRQFFEGFNQKFVNDNALSNQHSKLTQSIGTVNEIDSPEEISDTSMLSGETGYKDIKPNGVCCMINVDPTYHDAL
ncbi:MAG: serine/threonine-protein phosphatase 6 regulatory ankyrin repeat subunit A-like [Rickettsiaceae bacterium]|jgi:ankyrin repeat protein|nr:serine/threonine-protein phosphatase 6 regulatory ankyrin repeat subunit A-like [Rickettsiaceae bacterium]